MPRGFNFEMDSITIYVNCRKYYFVTAIDIVTKFDRRCILLVMAKPEVVSAPALEKIPFWVKQAAKLVPVKDYLRLRYQSDLITSSTEFDQLAIAGKVMQKKETSYLLVDEVKFSVPGLILSGVDLATYLAARVEAINKLKRENKKRIESCTGWNEEEARGWRNWGEELGKDLVLTQAVAEAAGINLRGESS